MIKIADSNRQFAHTWGNEVFDDHLEDGDDEHGVGGHQEAQQVRVGSADLVLERPAVGKEGLNQFPVDVGPLCELDDAAG